MWKAKNKIEQSGTLLVEALAMLGLIAMVTPTLYKKSAERLQEIQDINGASQARTMSASVDAFIRANMSPIMKAMSTGTSTLIIPFDDNVSGDDVFELGYSSYLPYGFKPDEIHNYLEPKVYVHKDKDTLISYVIYPKAIDLGQKRAARMASLVGANGGMVVAPHGLDKTKEAKGTGGAWYLNSSMVDELDFDPAVMTPNSLIVTSNEPVSMSYDDNAKYLYRIPPDSMEANNQYFHNTMVTDLYMGGDNGELTDYQQYNLENYSIYNVRKLTLNTNCNRDHIRKNGSSSPSCDPDVADLYIGAPVSKNLQDSTYNRLEANNGAAWIFGNLSALNESFNLYRATNGSGKTNNNREGYVEGSSGLERASNYYDVLEFSNNEDTSSYSIFKATNNNSGDRAEVSMMDGFVKVTQGADAENPHFLVKGSNSSELIKAYEDHSDGNNPTVWINTGNKEAITHINAYGGTVRINEGKDDTDTDKKETYINANGGLLKAGKDGGWISAGGKDHSAYVHLLTNNANSIANDNRKFTVGHEDFTENHMIYADKDKVSLRKGGLLVYYGTDHRYSNKTRLGGPSSGVYDNDVKVVEDGLTAIATKDTDIFGATYIGAKAMGSTSADDGSYNRDQYVLGIAGSAWVDDLLWARRAWLKDAGFGELHAGHDNFKNYNANSKNALLNVYKDKLIVRNKNKIPANSIAEYTDADAMAVINSSKVYFSDTYSSAAEMWLEGGIANIGTGGNYFRTNDKSSNVVGSSLVNIYTTQTDTSGNVNLQNGGLLLSGQWDDNYQNEILSKTGLFRIRTGKHVSVDDPDKEVDGAQFYADWSTVGTQFVNFQVLDNSSKAVFKVMPNESANSKTGDANVNIDGTLHIKGNEVIHVASNSSNTADKTNRAMLEIDPDHINVWSVNPVGGGFVGRGDEYYATLKINPKDNAGGSSDVIDTQDASIYVRKGAIELEQSMKVGDAGVAADEGFGYIKASRFVDNSGKKVPVPENAANAYDQFMVNPAYTSVMHDIKITSRGGARLSDALPDYVLKGIYNVYNNCHEEKVLPGDNSTPAAAKCDEKSLAYSASPFVGIVPYGLCPPRYRNMATLIPTSFMMGQAGDLMKASNINASDRWVVNPYKRQATILKKAAAGNGLVYPGLEEVESLNYNGIVQSNSSHSGFSPDIKKKTEGWYWGLKAIYQDASALVTNSELTSTTDYNITTYTYKKDAAGELFSVVQPLYFQQNNWLKTSLYPVDNGWKAYMGFLYDATEWGNTITIGDATIGGQQIKNSVVMFHDKKGYNDASNSPTDHSGQFLWNVFPIPTNSLEGIAHVYCYFDRSAFNDGEWSGLVDQVDQLENYRDNKNSSSDAVKRLSDPSLKYSDPW